MDDLNARINNYIEKTTFSFPKTLEIVSKQLTEIVNKMSSNSEIQKSKIYLKPGEKPPKGIQVMQGKRGGYYYEAGGRAAQAQQQMAPEKQRKLNRALDKLAGVKIDDIDALEKKYVGKHGSTVNNDLFSETAPVVDAKGKISGVLHAADTYHRDRRIYDYVLGYRKDGKPITADGNDNSIKPERAVAWKEQNMEGPTDMDVIREVCGKFDGRKTNHPGNFDKYLSRAALSVLQGDNTKAIKNMKEYYKRMDKVEGAVSGFTDSAPNQPYDGLRELVRDMEKKIGMKRGGSGYA